MLNCLHVFNLRQKNESAADFMQKYLQKAIETGIETDTRVLIPHMIKGLNTGAPQETSCSQDMASGLTRFRCKKPSTSCQNSSSMTSKTETVTKIYNILLQDLARQSNSHAPHQANPNTKRVPAHISNARTRKSTVASNIESPKQQGLLKENNALRGRPIEMPWTLRR